MATEVAGEMYETITGQLFEIGRQLRQPIGYPFNPEDLKNHLQAAIEGRFGESGQKKGLLRQITTVSVSRTEKFIAKDHLKTANIGWTGDNFDKLFLKKVEEKVEGITVVIHRLEKGSLDVPILAELGNRAEISLAHLFQLIEKQSKGEEGLLLVNGYVNIAYISGTDGNLWAVFANWDSGRGCWLVGALLVGDPRGWDEGSQVLFRA